MSAAGGRLDPESVFYIEDEETFELLADQMRVEILELLLVPRSVTEVAEAMGVPRTRLYHHVRLLEEKGLIRVVDTREVGALTERIYHVSAWSFRPSDAFLEQASPRLQAEAVLASILATTRADFVRAADEGIFSLGDRREKRSATLSRRLMRLTPDRLHRFVTELEELLDRYDDDQDTGPDAITVGVLDIVYPSSRKAT